MKDRQRNLILVLVLILLVSISGMVYILLEKDKDGAVDVGVSQTEGEIITFSGTLEDYQSDCAFDGQCIAFVESYEIIIIPGFTTPDIVLGSSDVNSDHIGRKVRVRAKVVSDNLLTIVGDESLYVLLDIE